MMRKKKLGDRWKFFIIIPKIDIYIYILCSIFALIYWQIIFLRSLVGVSK